MIGVGFNVSREIAGILSRFDTPFGLDLDFDGCRLRILASDARLRDELASYFADFAGGEDAPEIVIHAVETPEYRFDAPLREREPDAGKRKIKEESHDDDSGRLVRKRLTGMQFLFTRDLNLAVGPCLANVNQVVNFINNRHIQHLLHRGGRLLHAAGVTRGGAGLAVCGFSGMGKSTLSLHLVGAGMDFLSNDRIVLRPDRPLPRMHGVAKLPRINPGTILHNPRLHALLPDDRLAELRRLDPADLWSLEEKYDADLALCFGPGRFRIAADMRALVILNWRRDGGAFRAAEISPEDRPDLFPAYSKSTGLFFLPHPDQPSGADGGHETPDRAGYLDALAGCRVFEFSGGADFAAAADFCQGLLPEPQGRAEG